nr:potassium/proton antiporter [Allomeiothermus silvanus]
MVAPVSIDHILLVSALLLLASVLVSRISDRLGVPALVVFTGLGMLAGSDGPGGIYFDDARIAQGLGVVALVIILYSGGLDTDWRKVRPVVWQAVSLATLGVALTAALVGLFAILVLELPPLIGFLLGAIVSSTDAAAVFSVLRAGGVRLQERLQSLLELESGSNDPMAVLLTVGLIELILQRAGGLELAGLFVKQLGLGVLLGFALGHLMTWVLRRLAPQNNGLYFTLSLALALLCYSVVAVLGGSGFLAVYLAGLVVGQQELRSKADLRLFHEGLAWLMQIVMFLTLGLLVFPSQLPPVLLEGTLSALFLILVARPLSVLLSLWWFRLPWNELLLVGWVGLRGAVPIVLATFPLLAGVAGANQLFNLVFFIVLSSVALQGPTLNAVARWLGLEEPATPQPDEPARHQPTP